MDNLRETIFSGTYLTGSHERKRSRSHSDSDSDSDSSSSTGSSLGKNQDSIVIRTRQTKKRKKSVEINDRLEDNLEETDFDFDNEIPDDLRAVYAYEKEGKRWYRRVGKGNFPWTSESGGSCLTPWGKQLNFPDSTKGALSKIKIGEGIEKDIFSKKDKRVNFNRLLHPTPGLKFAYWPSNENAYLSSAMMARAMSMRGQESNRKSYTNDRVTSFNPFTFNHSIQELHMKRLWRILRLAKVQGNYVLVLRIIKLLYRVVDTYNEELIEATIWVFKSLSKEHMKERKGIILSRRGEKNFDITDNILLERQENLTNYEEEEEDEDEEREEIGNIGPIRFDEKRDEDIIAFKRLISMVSEEIENMRDEGEGKGGNNNHYEGEKKEGYLEDKREYKDNVSDNEESGADSDDNDDSEDENQDEDEDDEDDDDSDDDNNDDEIDRSTDTSTDAGESVDTDTNSNSDSFVDKINEYRKGSEIQSKEEKKEDAYLNVNKEKKHSLQGDNENDSDFKANKEYESRLDHESIKKKFHGMIKGTFTFLTEWKDDRGLKELVELLEDLLHKDYALKSRDSMSIDRLRWNGRLSLYTIPYAQKQLLTLKIAAVFISQGRYKLASKYVEDCIVHLQNLEGESFIPFQSKRLQIILQTLLLLRRHLLPKYIYILAQAKFSKQRLINGNDQCTSRLREDDQLNGLEIIRQLNNLLARNPSGVIMELLLIERYQRSVLDHSKQLQVKQYQQLRRDLNVLKKNLDNYMKGSYLIQSTTNFISTHQFEENRNGSNGHKSEDDISPLDQHSCLLAMWITFNLAIAKKNRFFVQSESKKHTDFKLKPNKKIDKYIYPCPKGVRHHLTRTLLSYMVDYLQDSNNCQYMPLLRALVGGIEKNRIQLRNRMSDISTSQGWPFWIGSLFFQMAASDIEDSKSIKILIQLYYRQIYFSYNLFEDIREKFYLRCNNTDRASNCTSSMNNHHEKNRSLVNNYEKIPLQPLVHLIMKHIYCCYIKIYSTQRSLSKCSTNDASEVPSSIIDEKEISPRNCIKNSDGISVDSRKSTNGDRYYCIYCNYSSQNKVARWEKHLKKKTHLLNVKYYRNNLILNSIYKENQISDPSTERRQRWIGYLSLLRFLVDMINSFDCVYLHKDLVSSFFPSNEDNESPLPNTELNNSLFYNERWYKFKCMGGSFKSRHPLFQGIEYFALDFFDVESQFPFFTSPYRTNDGEDESESSDFDEILEHTNPPINPGEMGYEKCNKYCYPLPELSNKIMIYFDLMRNKGNEKEGEFEDTSTKDPSDKCADLSAEGKYDEDSVINNTMKIEQKDIFIWRQILKQHAKASNHSHIEKENTNYDNADQVLEAPYESNTVQAYQKFYEENESGEGDSDNSIDEGDDDEDYEYEDEDEEEEEEEEENNDSQGIISNAMGQLFLRSNSGESILEAKEGRFCPPRDQKGNNTELLFDIKTELLEIFVKANEKTTSNNNTNSFDSKNDFTVIDSYLEAVHERHHMNWSPERVNPVILSVAYKVILSATFISPYSLYTFLGVRFLIKYSFLLWKQILVLTKFVTISSQGKGKTRTTNLMMEMNKQDECHKLTKKYYAVKILLKEMEDFYGIDIQGCLLKSEEFIQERQSYSIKKSVKIISGGKSRIANYVPEEVEEEDSFEDILPADEIYEDAALTASSLVLRAPLPVLSVSNKTDEFEDSIISRDYSSRQEEAAIESRKHGVFSTFNVDRISLYPLVPPN